jgi:hypothetical protein
MSLDSASSVERYLAEVRKSDFFKGEDKRGSFAHRVTYYQRRVAWQRTPYRISGVLVITLSIALPIIAAFGLLMGLNKDLWVSIIAGVIAFLAGINSFFRWDVGLKGAIQTLLALRRLHSNWELAIAKAKMQPDVNEGIKLAIEATEQFQKNTHELVESETKGFFTLQQFPNIKNEEVK